jgi:hypothetical protein
MKEFAEGKWTSEGPIGVGSTAYYVGVHKRNKGEEWNAEVTEFVKNKSLTIDAMLEAYYKYRGWDQNGIPTKNKLMELQISSY